MPALNDYDPSWDLEDLAAIHGLGNKGVDPEWAIEGIALDLGITVTEVKEQLVTANIQY